MQGRTSIFISHRISTVRHADQIAVLVNGRIAELGAHDDLMEKNGYYADLFQPATSRRGTCGLKAGHSLPALSAWHIRRR